ncbi:MAG: CocE/NonD family hydrolase [Solirubrobacteraceae bacterium MAG38_C4-C5]|nr:CocE/NonD family hydrolase [Candidatus Siliceabacter maunaloa]
MSLASAIAARRLRLVRPQTRAIAVQADLEVAMEDGAVLLADRYAPRGARPGPTVLVRSPYGRSGVVGVLLGRLLAERGLQVVVQSTRGTFGSGGELNPFDERADGLATLRWLAAQPWHHGSIGMFGPSYMGLTQWAVAREAGEALGAIAPSITASQFHGQAYGGGSISLDTAVSWLVMVAAQQRRLGTVRMVRGLRRLPGLWDLLPLGDLPAAAVGYDLPAFADWLAHTAADDPYWAARDHSAGVGEVTAPVQLVGGWHDIFLPWMLDDFAALQAAGRRAQLVVGPWTHTSPGAFAASLREGLAWLRAHLLDDPRMLGDAPVRVHVGGEGGGGWRALPAWPPPATALRLRLRAGGRLEEEAPGEGAPSGGADEGPFGEDDDTAPDRFRYDPAAPTPSLGGPLLLGRTPSVDNATLEARDDVLTYTTAPLDAALEAIGPIGVELHVRSSRDHFDVFARVCDVDTAGVSRNVCDALERVAPARHERGPDGVVRLVFALWPTAHRFAAGHAIRLQVSAGAHPRYARNPGTGEDPATATRLVAADQEVFHDAARPSVVVLPSTQRLSRPA